MRVPLLLLLSIRRALVQKCEGIQMKNLITFGGQHQGVAGFPNCPVGGPICDSIRDLVNTAAYRPVIQNRYVTTTAYTLARHLLFCGEKMF